MCPRSTCRFVPLLFVAVAFLMLAVSTTAQEPVIASDSATIINESCVATNGVIDPNETVTVNLALKNIGSADASNVVATLLATGGVTAPSGPQSYGLLPAGGPVVNKSFSFIATGSCGGTLTAVLQIQNGITNLGNATNVFSLGTSINATTSQTNTTSLAIPASGTGASTGAPASLYPSTVFVSGFSGPVTKVTVALFNITHTFPADIDVLLVGPTGQSIILMSDVGGGNVINNVTITLDDAAAASLTAAAITAGTYKPTNIGAGDPFPPPASTIQLGTALSAFNGLDPNGTWSLYVVDDAAADVGSMGGWALNITTSSNACCTVAGDSDGDGLPDAWEILYFGNLNQGPNDDPDGDGMTNVQEYLAGTNPIDPGSALRITAIARETNNLRVTWTMGSGKTNALQVTSGSGNGSFATNNLANLFIVTNTVGSVTNFLDLGAATNVPSRFYRIRVLP